MQDDLSVRTPGIATVDSGGGGLSGGQPRDLGPEDDFARVERCCKAADIDEHERCWNPDAHPKAPHPREEAVTDREGTGLVDVQRDSPLVDDVAEFDLDADDLFDVDL